MNLISSENNLNLSIICQNKLEKIIMKYSNWLKGEENLFLLGGYFYGAHIVNLSEHQLSETNLNLLYNINNVIYIN